MEESATGFGTPSRAGVIAPRKRNFLRMFLASLVVIAAVITVMVGVGMQKQKQAAAAAAAERAAARATTSATMEVTVVAQSGEPVNGKPQQKSSR